MTQEAPPFARCGTCGKIAERRGTATTLVGHHSPVGHNHDTNCRTGTYVCDSRHSTYIPVRNRCYAKDCEWRGKETCFCHEGKKVEEDDPMFPGEAGDASS